MSAEQAKETNGTIGMPAVAGIVGVSLLPTVLSLIGILPGEGADWLPAMLRTCSFAFAFIVAIMCLMHFSVTGEITGPMLAVALICAGNMELWLVATQAARGGGAIASDAFLSFAWNATRLFYAAALIVIASILLFSGRVKGEGNRRRASARVSAIGLVLLFASSLVMWFGVTHPETFLDLYGGEARRMVWKIAPIALLAAAGLYVLPSYFEWHRTLFAQMLILSCLPLVLAQVHFIWGGADARVVSSLLVMLGYLLPLVGMLVDYRNSLRATRDMDRRLQEALLAESAVKSASNRERGLSDAVLEAIVDPVCVFDSSLHVLRMNRAQAQLLGAESVSAMVGKDPTQIGFDVQVAERARQALALNQTMVVPPAPFHGSKTGLTIEWRFTPIRGAGDPVVAVACVGRVRG